MQVTVEDVSSVKKTLHIEIPKEDVVRELNSAYNNLKKNAKIKGFRPGKAPRSVLERMFKKDVHADVSSQLIQSSFVDAIKETDLQIVGQPQVDPPELDAAASYKYDAKVEIRPEIEDIDYKGLQLERSKYQISDEEIDGQLKMLQKNLARTEPISEDRGAREGDFLLIDYEGFKDGEPFAETQKTENFTMKLGDGYISKDFDEQLVGMKAGGAKEFTATFADDYFNKKLAGLTLSFQTTLNEIREEILPEIDDELAKKTGQYETLDDLKQVIRDNLNQGYEKRIEQELNEQIFSGLLAKADFEVPDTLVDMELEGIIEEAERSFSQRNTTLEDVGLTREFIAEKYRETALKQVKRHLILGKMIDQEKIEVSDEELEEGLQEMSANFNQPVDQIKSYYDQNKERLEFFKHTLLEKKAINLIIDSSDIKDVEPKNEDEPATEEGTTSDES